jgi:aspartyl-tRNA(Asn)/glutamyl-tRNA(Gln) amidotransferase subunit A
MTPSSLADSTACELLAGYRSREISPVDAARAVLQRIEEWNPRLNAFSLIDADSALAAARQSEQRWTRDAPLGPFDGIPVSVKDLLLARGWPTRRGSLTVDARQSWEVDAPAVARLRESGAVLLGKTCTAEFGCKCETNSPATGLTRNPWDPARSPGGSSGGSAAAVAAGMGPVSVGTDGAGSIRLPAAFCGNFGLKPSFGRVPTFPPSAFGSLSHIGVLTMSVEDAALALNLLSRPDPRDWTALPPGGTDYLQGLQQGVAGLRVAYAPRASQGGVVDPEVADAVDRAVGAFREMGALVCEVEFPAEGALDIIGPLWLSGSWSVWQGLSDAQRAVSDPDFRDQALQGRAVTAEDLHRVMQQRALLGSRMKLFMRDHDLLVTPTVPIPASEAQAPGYRPADLESLIGWTPFTYPFNLTQQPAASIPCGRTRSGLPIGLQIVGPMFDDALVLRAARAYERIRPIARPPLSTAPEDAA